MEPHSHKHSSHNLSSFNTSLSLSPHNIAPSQHFIEHFYCSYKTLFIDATRNLPLYSLHSSMLARGHYLVQCKSLGADQLNSTSLSLEAATLCKKRCFVCVPTLPLPKPQIARTIIG